MGVSIPSHLLAETKIALSRAAHGGLSGYRDEEAPLAPYWQGTGYVSLALKSRVDITKTAGAESAVLTGPVFFYLEDSPTTPTAADTLSIEGVPMQLISIRLPSALVEYVRAEVRTGTQ